MITARILKLSLTAASAGLRISIQTAWNLAMGFTHSLERSSFRLPQELLAECRYNVRPGCTGSDHPSSSPRLDPLFVFGLGFYLSLSSRFAYLPSWTLFITIVLGHMSTMLYILNVYVNLLVVRANEIFRIQDNVWRKGIRSRR
jgi:hypothetical protein